jgi:hypothetical protein
MLCRCTLRAWSGLMQSAAYWQVLGQASRWWCWHAGQATYGTRAGKAAAAAAACQKVQAVQARTVP